MMAIHIGMRWYHTVVLMAIDRWMNKENVVHIYNGMLLLLSNCKLVSPYDPMNCSPLCSSVHGISQGVGCHFLLQGICWPRDQTYVFCIAGGFFTIEPSGKPTMEYYSAIKKEWIWGSCSEVDESRAVIQSEVSKKERNKYHILTHLCGI